MKISYRPRISRSFLQRAELVLTVISLCGSIVQYSLAQESTPPTPSSEAVPAKSIPAPVKEPTRTFEVPQELPATPGSQDQGSTRLVPFEDPPPKADNKLPTRSDPAQADSSKSDARRLQLLEKQILELSGELRALRAERRSGMATPTAPFSAPASSRRSPSTKQLADQNPATLNPLPGIPVGGIPATDTAALQPRSATTTGVDVIAPSPRAAAFSRNPLPGNPDVQSVTITRSTYKLPAGRAEALAKLLAELLDDEIDIKVKGDALQVTAPAADQQAIERVIALFLRRGRPPKPDGPNLDPISGSTEQETAHRVENSGAGLPAAPPLLESASCDAGVGPRLKSGDSEGRC